MAVNTLRAAETVVASRPQTNEVTVADATGFEPLDEIIVESDHGYDEVGLDGNWDWSSYYTSPAYDANYYFSALINKGKSWMGTVTAVNGSTLTLSRTIDASCVGLRVLRDNTQGIKATIEANGMWPEQETFYCAMQDGNAGILVYLPATAEETHDFRGCTIQAPRGCPALSIRVNAIGGGGPANKHYKNLILKGNVKDAGYGVGALSALYFAWSMDSNQKSIIENFDFHDNWRSVGGSYCSDMSIYDCNTYAIDGLRSYIQWDYQVDHASRIVFDNCTVDSDWARGGFEPFKSAGVTFSRCGGRNTGFSCNTSGRILYKDCYCVWDNNSLPASWSINNPIININRTIENQQGTPQVGTDGGCFIDGFRMEYQALPAAGRLQRLVTVGGGTSGIDTGARMRNITYINPFPDSTDGNSNAQGYIVAGDFNATDTRFGGTNNIAVLNNGPIYYKGGAAATPNEDLTPLEP